MIPFIISMVILVCGARATFAISHTSAETPSIHVVGKQWMWRFQHLDRQREINELHLPVGRAVKLVTASEVTAIAASQRQAMLSGAAPERSLASAGAKVFQDLRCNACHRPGAQGLSERPPPVRSSPDFA